MNLHGSLRYPLLKFLIEEFSGSFYENDLTCLNRMLILYHNHFLFSLSDDTNAFLNQYELSFQNSPFSYWYLNSAKRKRIHIIRARTVFLLTNNLGVLDQLLRRTDYSSPKAKSVAINLIYLWLKSIQSEQPGKDLDINQWICDIENQLGHLLDKSGHLSDSGNKKDSKTVFTQFHEILTGKDENQRKLKFDHLIDILVKEQWISSSIINGKYRFRNASRGGRLQLAALYFALDKNGHISQKLNAQQIAALFNSWIEHEIAPTSFVKIFQAAEQQTFNAAANETRSVYIQDCLLMIRKL